MVTVGKWFAFSFHTVFFPIQNTSLGKGKPFPYKKR